MENNMDLKPLKIFLGGASPFSDNRGVAAIFMGTLNMLSMTFSDRNMSITVWNTYPFSGRRYVKELATTEFQVPTNIEVNMIGGGDSGSNEMFRFLHAFSRLFCLLMVLVFLRFLSKIRINLLSRIDVVSEMFSADFVVELNFGDVFTDVHYGRKLWVFNTLRLFAIVISGKPIYLFPQSIGPFKSLISKALARIILKRVRIVAVREKYSLVNVKSLGIASKVSLVPDAGFRSSSVNADRALDILKAEGLNSEQNTKLIGLCVSPYYFSLPFMKQSALALNRFVEIIGDIIHEFDATVVFIPHDMSNDGTSFDCRQLSFLMRSMLKNKDRAIVLAKDYTVEEFWGVIGLCNITISMMTHPVIASLRAGVPVTAVTYSHKTGGIMSMFGLEGYVFTLEAFVHMNVGIGTVRKLLQHRVRISQNLKKNMHTINVMLEDFQRQFLCDVVTVVG